MGPWSPPWIRWQQAEQSPGPGFTDNGSVFSLVFPTAGTYPYDCGIHGPAMAGTIVVK